MALNDTDIPARRLSRYSRFVVNSNGFWVFDSPANHAVGVRKNTTRYYRMPVEFGITRSNAVAADDIHLKGNPGDYAVLHITGEYSIVSDAEFKLLNSTTKT